MWAAFKTILAYFFILSGFAVLVISTSRELTWKIRLARGYYVTDAWWGQYASKWGDLVNMAYLDKVKKFCAPKDYQFAAPADDCKKNIDLYLYGDSYTNELPATVYASLHAYYHQHRVEDFYYNLDSNFRNILLIEFSERFVAEELTTTRLFDVIKPLSSAKEAQKTDKIPVKKKSSFTDIFFNPVINQNLEYHLFDYNFLTGLRQLKGGLNYYVFNRASGDVTMSADGRYVFFKPTVADGRTGIYKPVERPVLDSIISSLNAIYDHYRKEGFEEVYFSIIPNAATILQPMGYNQFIPLLQNDRRLKMPLIDIYSVFKANTQPWKLYRAGDTHWSNNGLQKWLALTNNMLRMQLLR